MFRIDIKSVLQYKFVLKNVQKVVKYATINYFMVIYIGFYIKSSNLLKHSFISEAHLQNIPFYPIK